MQEHPVARIAHRTSPTNMGFALLAGLVARDFGYITSSQLLQRLEAALATMEGPRALPRHFLQLVRHRDAAAAASRTTSRRSTAATSRASC
jgi:hypothetical protein